jgi:hypothetical protein
MVVLYIFLYGLVQTFTSCKGPLAKESLHPSVLYAPTIRLHSCITHNVADYHIALRAKKRENFSNMSEIFLNLKESKRVQIL